MHFSTFLSGAALFQLSIAGYVLEDDYMRDFYGAFEFFTDPDPTSGFVQYVDEATARKTNLISSNTTVPVQWGVDHSNKTPEGRPSIRITSKKSYDKGLVVLDVEHMPFGCGTWPAFWMVGPDWPTNGEIDILEGVNEQEVNGMTLHTGPNCAIGSDHGIFAGEVETHNCDVKAKGQSENAGCSISHPSKNSYGAGLNDIKGGVYATEWTEDAISVWFFPRGDIPQDALGNNPDPTAWGKPAAKFTGNCDIGKTFSDNKIVFDTTFCGDWAGNAWSSGSCASKAPTCNEYVRDNPEAFANAHWTVNGLRVYQNNGEAPKPSLPVSPPKSTRVHTSTAEPTSEASKPTATPSTESTIEPTSALVSTSAAEPSVEPIITPTFEPSLESTVKSTAKPTSTLVGTSTPVDVSIVIPVPTSSKTPSVITPSGSSSEDSTPLPTNSNVIPSATPSELPTSVNRPSRTSGQPGSGKLTQSRQPPIAQPTAGVPQGPMSGFVWPKASGEKPDDSPTPTPAEPTSSPLATAIPLPSTGSPVLNSPSNALPIPTTIQTQAKAAGNAPAPQPTSDADLPKIQDASPTPAPIVSEVIEWETVWQTFYVTVPPPAATPAAAAGARKARHVREHRRRLTQHNVRR